MVYARLHRNIVNIQPAGASEDFLYGLRGGILLSLKLTWQPFTFLNQGTDEEVPRGGDIHVIVADAGTTLPVLGQIGATLTDSPIVVPNGGSWEWDHPYAPGMRDCIVMIEKMAFHPFAIMPIGILQGALRIIAQQEPVRAIAHSLIVEAEFIGFDVNLT